MQIRKFVKPKFIRLRLRTSSRVRSFVTKFTCSKAFAPSSPRLPFPSYFFNKLCECKTAPEREIPKFAELHSRSYNTLPQTTTYIHKGRELQSINRFCRFPTFWSLPRVSCSFSLSLALLSLSRTSQDTLSNYAWLVKRAKNQKKNRKWIDILFIGLVTTPMHFGIRYKIDEKKLTSISRQFFQWRKHFCSSKQNYK